jgi:hypothetical protein
MSEASITAEQIADLVRSLGALPANERALMLAVFKIALTGIHTGGDIAFTDEFAQSFTPGEAERVIQTAHGPVYQSAAAAHDDLLVSRLVSRHVTP